MIGAIPSSKMNDDIYDFSSRGEMPIRVALGSASSAVSAVSAVSSLGRSRGIAGLSVAQSFSRGGTAGRNQLCRRSDDDLRSISSSMSKTRAKRRPPTAASFRSSGSSGSDEAVRKRRTPAVVADELRTQISALIDKSTVARRDRKVEESLDLAREAVLNAQSLQKHNKSHSLPTNGAIMLSTWFNLAVSFEVNDMVKEAIKTYAYLAKQSTTDQGSCRVRLSMGNLYYVQKDYSQAIRMFKMALDLTPRGDKRRAQRIQCNIANAYFRIGKLNEAIKHSECHESPRSIFNLIIFRLSLGDVEGAENEFRRLLAARGGEADPSDQSNREMAEKAARLLSATAGHERILALLEGGHDDIADAIELEFALGSLKNADNSFATKALRSLHKKSSKKASAAICLSFVYLLERNMGKAKKYSEAALKSDGYNSTALVNKGNCLFEEGKIADAKSCYLDAIVNRPDCAQAVFNLGLANQQLGLLSEAIKAFEQLHQTTPNSVQVLYQIANTQDMMGSSPEEAIKWFNVLAGRVPGASSSLARLGHLYSESGDETQALHCSLESYRHNPTDLDIISWLGSWFAENGMYERQV